jgi:transcriptional regulator with XRE-family HTH domain
VDFAQALKERRASRRLSQLELALKAGTTQRHLSFIESGRSVPGREMVIRLTESLGLPLRERNELLLRAGYAPAYPDQALDSTALAPVMDALGHILAGHLPYPAIIVDRGGDIVAANSARSLLFEGCAGWLLEPPVNAYRVALHPEGMAARIANFGEWARHVLHGVEAELARGHAAAGDPLAVLYEELTGYVPPARLLPGHLGFAVPLELRSSRGGLRLITTITNFATATDVTVSELRLEAFLPADAATAAALHAHARLGP